MPAAATWFGQVYAVALNVFYFAAAWVLGDQIRLRRQREADLSRRTAELAARTIELETERARSERGGGDRRAAAASRANCTTSSATTSA